MSIESLTVKLHNGETYYFTAGAVVGDSANRIDLLREAIENSSDFFSADEAGMDRHFNGADVANYHLS